MISLTKRMRFLPSQSPCVQRSLRGLLQSEYRLFGHALGQLAITDRLGGLALSKASLVRSNVARS
jgi:hypothetical protein